jgi:hypothetical protein
MSALTQDWHAWFIALGALHWFIYTLVFTGVFENLFVSKTTKPPRENNEPNKPFWTTCFSEGPSTTLKAFSDGNVIMVKTVRGLATAFFFAVWIAFIVAVCRNGIVRGNTMHAEAYIRNVFMLTVYTVSAIFLLYVVGVRMFEYDDAQKEARYIDKAEVRTAGKLAIALCISGYWFVYGVLYLQVNDSTDTLTGYNIADIVCISVLVLVHAFITVDETVKIVHFTSNVGNQVTPGSAETLLSIDVSALNIKQELGDAVEKSAKTKTIPEPPKYGILPGKGVKAEIPFEIMAGYVVNSIIVGFEVCGDYGSLTLWNLFVVVLPIFASLWSSSAFWLEHWIVSHLIIAFAYSMFNSFTVWGNHNFIPEDNPNTRHLFIFQDHSNEPMKWTTDAVMPLRWFLTSVNITLAAVAFGFRFASMCMSKKGAP